MIAVFAVVLSACDFDPPVPAPANDGGVAIGARPFVNLYGEASLRLDLRGHGVTQADLEALAGPVAAALARSSAPTTAETRHVFQQTEIMSVDVSVLGAWTPGLSDIGIDGPMAASVLSGLGFDLVHLHWCPPDAYEIQGVKPGGLQLDPTYRCIIWDSAERIDAVEVTLGSERGSLWINVAAFSTMLAAAVWSIAHVLWAGLRRRRVRWPAVLGGLGVWFGALAAYFFLVAFSFPMPSVIVAIEPADSWFGVLFDSATVLVSQAGVVGGLIAVGYAIVGAVLSLPGVRRAD